ncbi:Uncharacterized protein DBV15_09480 [Temnothorax longispinosus]|uniref:Uncharacterized protein n=1 Tax=Temnothorax longispinosus TaxID=300112 RepID=A0A4S2L6G4_9HYME|nr:Uncharacterized protein DBV15_09480 [Temnothorax longispinosus]
MDMGMGVQKNAQEEEKRNENLGNKYIRERIIEFLRGGLSMQRDAEYAKTVLGERVSWILFAERQSGSFDIPQVSFAREYRKGFRVGLKDCVAATPAVVDWRKLVSICHGSLASCLRNGFGASSIYGSGVAVIRCWAKSGAKHDGVGPMPAKIEGLLPHENLEAAISRSAPFIT